MGGSTAVRDSAVRVLSVNAVPLLSRLSVNVVPNVSRDTPTEDAQDATRGSLPPVVSTLSRFCPDFVLDNTSPIYRSVPLERFQGGFR